MATTTTQLVLRKPVGSDQVNVTTDIADNMQKIDDAFNPTTGHSHAGTTGNGPQIGTSGVADSAITTAKIAANSVDGTKIALGSDASGDLMYYDGANWARHPGGNRQLSNLLLNGNFELWSAGASSVPDGWLLSGAGSSAAREGTIKKVGAYSAKLTRAGADCVLYANQTSQPSGRRGYGVLDMVSLADGVRQLTVGAWVYATVASRIRLRCYDGTTFTYSSFHTGGSSWEWLTATFIPAASPSQIQVALQIVTGDTSGYIDGAILVEGPVAPAFYPHPADLVQWLAGANIASAGAVAIGTDGNYFHITGTTTITAFSGMLAGMLFVTEFDGQLTLTHHATSFILPNNGSNITTAAGDVAFWEAISATSVKCVSYQRASGQAVAGGGAYTPTVIGNTAYANLTGNGSSKTLGASNDAWFMPIDIPGSMTITKIGLYITTSSGNLDVGIYNSAGTKLVSSGSIASPGTGNRWITVASTALSAGQHWIAVAANNTTIAFGVGTGATALGSDTAKVVGSSFALPASFTPPTIPSGTTGFTPAFMAVA